MKLDVKFEKDRESGDGLLVIGDKRINILEMYEIEIPVSGIKVNIYTNRDNFVFSFDTVEETQVFLNTIMEIITKYQEQDKVEFRIEQKFLIYNNIVAVDGMRKKDLEKDTATYKKFLKSNLFKLVKKM